MKLKKISLAVAAALAAGAAGNAAALSPATYTTANTLDVYLSGASAQDSGVLALMRRVCVAGSMDAFTAPNQAVFFCQVNTSQLTGLTKPNIAVRKYSAGGSGNGVIPVADGTALPFFDMSLLAASTVGCGAVTTVPAVTSVSDPIGLPQYNTRACPIASYSSNQVPDAGFSDVEPVLFGATAAQVANLTVKSANAVIFGIPVTLKLRDALQAAQSLAIGSDTEANMPSLKSTQVASMLNGNLTNWSSLGNNAGAPLSNTVSDTVYVVRRVSSSGTQTFAQVHFLNQLCTTGVVPFLPANDAGTDATCGDGAAGNVFAGSGGSNVKICLGHHDSAGRWAVGILTTEDSTPTATSNTWRHIKLDGYAPTQLNVFNGDYTYWSEQTLQWRKTTNPLAGQPLTFMTQLATKLGDPFVISQLDQQSVHPFGNAGLMALGLNFTPPNPTAGIVTAAVLAANPVTTSTRAPTLTTNNCQPPAILWPTTAK